MEAIDPKERGRRTFTLLPLRNNFVPGSIEITPTNLLELLNRARKKPCNFRLLEHGETAFSREWMKENGEKVWKELFCFEKMETKNRRFAHHIKTNGYQCSVMLKSVILKKPKKPKTMQGDNFNRLVGMDPGMTYIAVGSTDDGQLLNTTNNRR